MRILILGANGFIGSNLIRRLLAERPEYRIHAMDIHDDKLRSSLGNPKLEFVSGDMRDNWEWIESTIKRCNLVLPLAAIANPATYVNDPLTVFELDFEANLTVVRLCVKHGKRLVFPSTSEVYGMSPDLPYDEYSSRLVTGPIIKERWIYSTSKQLLDRVIYAYGNHHNLDFTLFRPFNWYGPGLDEVYEERKTNRVVPHFLGQLLRHQPLTLVDGGKQTRCFLHIDDGLDAILRIIDNPKPAHQQTYNLGDPESETSIGELADMMMRILSEHAGYEDIPNTTKLKNISGDDYYGHGYQDIERRVPMIDNAMSQLGWLPTINLEDGMRQTIGHYVNQRRETA